MSIKTAAATLTGLLVLAGSPAAAQTQAGIAVGATISAGGLGVPLAPDVTVAGWLAGPIRGPVEWRVEFSRERLRLRGDTTLLCWGRVSSVTPGLP